MTKSIVCIAVLAASFAACGKYGPPEPVGTRTPGATEEVACEEEKPS